MTKEELEKEAEEYADWFWGASPSMMKALAEAYIKGAEPREKQIAELKKENAELKKELVEKGQHLDLTEREWGKDMSKMIHYKTQLTKAKELLKRCYDNYIHLEPLRSEIEQFLNSEVEK